VPTRWSRNDADARGGVRRVLEAALNDPAVLPLARTVFKKDKHTDQLYYEPKGLFHRRLSLADETTEGGAPTVEATASAVCDTGGFHTDGHSELVSNQACARARSLVWTDDDFLKNGIDFKLDGVEMDPQPMAAEGQGIMDSYLMTQPMSWNRYTHRGKSSGGHFSWMHDHYSGTPAEHLAFYLTWPRAFFKHSYLMKPQYDGCEPPAQEKPGGNSRGAYLRNLAGGGAALVATVELDPAAVAAAAERAAGGGRRGMTPPPPSPRAEETSSDSRLVEKTSLLVAS
jgi:hypothetical protein